MSIEIEIVDTEQLKMNKEKMDLRKELQPNEITQEQKVSLRTRIISAIVAIVIVVPLIFIGNIPFFAMVIILGGVGAWEIVHAAKTKYNPLLYIVAIFLVILLATIPTIKNALTYDGSMPWNIYYNYDTLYVSAAVVLVGAVLCFLLVIIDKNFEARDACYLFTFGIILGLGLQSVLFLRFYPLHEFYAISGLEQSSVIDYGLSPCLLILVVGGSLMSDTGAYFTGMLFGKNKMNERISPKKTWEGFVGGVVFAMVFILTFGLVMAGTGHPIIKAFDMEHWYFLLIVAAIVPAVSQLGDFIFSSVKRYYGIKDFGKIMPGHGGVLDRVDSVLFASIVTTILIIIFNTGITNSGWENLFV
jgi:phosphatidate cytidylyltransferase